MFTPRLPVCGTFLWSSQRIGTEASRGWTSHTGPNSSEGGATGTCWRTAFQVKRSAGASRSRSKLRKVKRNSRIKLNVLPSCRDTTKGAVCHVPQCPSYEEPQKKFHSGPVIKRNCASSGTGMSTLRLLQIFALTVSLHVLTTGTFREKCPVYLLRL